MSARLDALAARLEAPLLVTNLTNVYYLTGFESSNAALLVEPGGAATLFTDFRYIESAREVAGVETQLTKRGLMHDVGERLSGSVQFEADVLPYLEWDRLQSGGAKFVPTSGIVDAVRAIKDEAEVAKLRRAA
jgi:Xaa-Pro aminopeptidase